MLEAIWDTGYVRPCLKENEKKGVAVVRRASKRKTAGLSCSALRATMIEMLRRLLWVLITTLR